MTPIQIDSFRKNIMGTLSFEMKMPGMRKSQEFIVYPVEDKSESITIQSDTRIGTVNMASGKVKMSKSHANGAYFYHLSSDTLDHFELSKEVLEKLKSELAKTAGSSVGSSFVKTNNSGADKFAGGGQTKSDAVEFGNFRKNIMGTLSFEMKIPGMRKMQEFIVYPVSGESKSIKIQSDSRIGLIDMSTGEGKMSESHSGGAYFVHLSMDKLTLFKLNSDQFELLKDKLASTAGSSVGKSIVKSDNSGADKFEEGGVLTESNINFENGKALIKSKGKTIAKIYYRPDFFEKQNVSWNRNYPYSIEVNGLSRECKNLDECIESYNSNFVYKFAEGGTVDCTCTVYPEKQKQGDYNVIDAKSKEIIGRITGNFLKKTWFCHNLENEIFKKCKTKRDCLQAFKKGEHNPVKMLTGGEVNEYDGTKYFSISFEQKGVKWNALFVWGKSNYISVKKVSNNPYGLLGKQFANIDEAIDHYKDASMKANLMFAYSEAKKKGFIDADVKMATGGNINEFLSTHQEMFDDNAKTLTKKQVIDFIEVSKDSDKKYWVKDNTSGYSYYIFRGKLRLNDSTEGILKTSITTPDRLKDNHQFKIKEENLYDWEKAMDEALKRENDPSIKKTDWEEILKKFNEIYFIEDGDNYWDFYDKNEISSSQVKAEERVWQFDRYSPYPQTLSWEEAENRFKKSLSKDQLDGIEIIYNQDEYADVESHDSDRYIETITIKKKNQKLAMGGGIEDDITRAKANAENKIDFEYYAKEYAGEHWEKLSPKDRAELISEIRENWFNDSYAKGGGIPSQKFNVGDRVSYSDGYQTFEGVITGDFTDERMYVGDKYGYAVTGFGDRLRPEQLTLISKATTTDEVELLPNPSYMFQRIPKTFIEDASKTSKLYQLAILLMKDTPNPDEKMNLDYIKYDRLLRAIISIPPDNRFTSYLRYDNYSLAQAEKWAKETLNELFILSTKDTKMATGGNTKDQSYLYQLLARLKADNDYYLGFGNRSEKRLWAGNVKDQIAEMKKIYNELEVKPEWLTMEEIMAYEREMFEEGGNISLSEKRTMLKSNDTFNF